MSNGARGYYKIRIQLEPQPEGGWTITSPDVPGLVTEADAPEEIEPNVQDAFSALMESYDDSADGLPGSLPRVPNSAFTIDTVVASG